MTSPLTAAVLKSGLVSKNQLNEFRRWGAPIEEVEMPAEKIQSIEQISQAIEEALHSDGYSIMRETDPQILHQYLKTQRQGVLHVEIPSDLLTVETQTDIQVSFGLSFGEYVIPWTSDSIQNEMTNGLTYLLVEGEQVYFSDVRELYYGEQKAFMLCRPNRRVKRPQMQSGESDGTSNDS